MGGFGWGGVKIAPQLKKRRRIKGRENGSVRIARVGVERAGAQCRGEAGVTRWRGILAGFLPAISRLFGFCCRYSNPLPASRSAEIPEFRCGGRLALIGAGRAAFLPVGAAHDAAFYLLRILQHVVDRAG